MKVKLIFKFIIFNYLFFIPLQAELIVKTDQGFLNGTTFETRHRTISAFLGIPYAQPPIGDLRFKNPVPGEKWNGIRSAHQAGNSCAQILENYIGGKEDCLYLNVYTPFLKFNSSMDNNKLLPVMVWIHGGAFSFKSSNPDIFGPKYLLDKDIVLVSMNYRLGIFGFFTTGDSVAPGNFGMKDQVLALKWVQKNIRNFGGNPNRVTIFGESSGGTSVNLHAISDLTHGLFHQYIIQSGTALGPMGYRNKKEYKIYITETAAKVGCLSDSSELLVNCLRTKSVESLLKAKPTIIEMFPEIIWVPTDESESEDAFLTDNPYKLISQNKMKDQPFISGTVMDEGLLVTLTIRAKKLSTERIKHLLKKSINSTSNYYLKPRNATKFRKIIEDYYFSKSINSVSKDKLLHGYTTFAGDSTFFYPQVSLISKMAKQAKSPFYFYSFGYFSLNMTNMGNVYGFKKNFGVPHAEELSYLFPKNTSTTAAMSEKDKKILNLLVDLWTSFAINGKPSSDQLEDPYLWQPYVKNKKILQIGNILNNTDSSVTMDDDYFSPRMEFWKKQFPLLNSI